MVTRVLLKSGNLAPPSSYGIRNDMSLSPRGHIGRTGGLATAGAWLQATARNATRKGGYVIRRHLSSHRLVSDAYVNGDRAHIMS